MLEQYSKNPSPRLYTPAFEQTMAVLVENELALPETLQNSPAEHAAREREEHVLAHSLARTEGVDSVKPVARNWHGTRASIHCIDGVYSRKVGKSLGIGGYARAYLLVDGGDDAKKPHHYVVKVVHIQVAPYLKNNGGMAKADTAEQQVVTRAQVEAEIAVLKKLGRFIRYDVRTNGKGVEKHYIVQQHVPGVTLFTYLETIKSLGRPLTLSEAKVLMVKITMALKALHEEAGVVHIDLHRGNVMLAADNQVGLIDFGFSRPHGETSNLGTGLTRYKNKPTEYPWFPPECF